MAMTAEQMIAYTDTMPLARALWWFIENVNEETAGRTDLFFHLRQRVRTEPERKQPGRKVKQSYVK